MMRKEEKEVERYIREHGMIRRGDVVAAGVSGGADSVCLLFMLSALAEKLGFCIRVCHVNHGLRGPDADADEQYVRELSERLGVPCRVFHKDVELIARKWKQSPEEAGRTARREAFETMCREEGCTKIATAHHREDNAETVLLNAARGTGLKGMCGIWPVRGRWIHPMLTLTKEQIESYLREKKVGWREDATNQEDTYTRNRVRNRVMPVLVSQINSGTERHLDELSRQAREVWDYLRQGTERAWERCVEQNKKAYQTGEKHGVLERERETCLRIRKDFFEKEMPAVQKQLLKRCISEVMKSERDIGAVHIMAVMDLFGRQTGKSLHLPGGVRAERIYDGIEIRRGEKESGGGKPLFDKRPEEVFLRIPGNTKIPGTGLEISCSFAEGAAPEQAREFPQKSYTKWIDYDIIKYRLSVRTRRSGDWIAVDGRGSRKKLKEYFIDEKIPREKRAEIPLVADGDQIVWIPGYRLNAQYRTGSGTERILEIKIVEEKKDVRDNQSTGSGRKS